MDKCTCAKLVRLSLALALASPYHKSVADSMVKASTRVARCVTHETKLALTSVIKGPRYLNWTIIASLASFYRHCQRHRPCHCHRHGRCHCPCHCHCHCLFIDIVIAIVIVIVSVIVSVIVIVKVIVIVVVIAFLLPLSLSLSVSLSSSLLSSLKRCKRY